MADLSVSMFGKFQVYQREGALDSALPKKARALIVYLLLHRRPHPREKLATLLWHGATKRTKAYLRKALWQLRQSLEPEEGDASPLIVTEGDWIQLNSEADLWIDVEVFETAFNAVRDSAASEMTEAEVNQLERAADLYTGDFLENWYQDWCLQERERLLDIYLRMLDRLASSCEARGMYDAGIEYGIESLRLAPARERTHRQLMRFRALKGNRTGALRQYERCADVLTEELGVSPATATRRLHEKILKDAFPPSSNSKNHAPINYQTGGAQAAGSDENRGAPRQDTDIDALRDGLDRIRELQSTLAAVQRRIRHDIDAVEVALQQRQ